MKIISVAGILLVLMLTSCYKPPPPVHSGDTTQITGPLTVAYVEVNSNNFNNVGCYMYDSSTTELFNIAIIFAANINYDDSSHKAVLYYNPQVSFLLDSTDYVKNLQSLGIKVLLSVLGNHEDAGWSCFTDSSKAKHFAVQLWNAVQQYGFDGIDIDDEYSACAGNDTSVIMVAHFMRQLMPKKIISKALFADIADFTSSWQGYKLTDILSYGWQISYGGNPAGRLQPYILAGMPLSKLGLGVSTTGRDGSSIATYVKTDSLAAITIYGITKSSQAYLSPVSQVLFGSNTDVTPGCLQ